MSQPIEDPPREEEEFDSMLSALKNAFVQQKNELKALHDEQRKREEEYKAILKSFEEIPDYSGNKYRPFIKYFKDNDENKYKRIQDLLKTIDEQLIKIHKENENNRELRIMISKLLYQEQFPRNGFEATIAALKNFVELLEQIIRQHNLHDEELAIAVGKLRRLFNF